MNYGEVRELFMDQVNRSDLTEGRADTFLSLGVSRIERALRSVFQKAELEVPQSAPNEFPIPADMLSIIDVSDPLGFLPRVTQTGDELRGYSIGVSRIVTKQAQPTITVRYYRVSQQTTNPTESTNLTSILPDLILYAALTYAGRHFIDDRRGEWEDTFRQFLAECQAFADEVEMSGHPTIRNPYEGIV